MKKGEGNNYFVNKDGEKKNHIQEVYGQVILRQLEINVFYLWPMALFCEVAISG